ncbi:MAG: ankyrin repeat domain-containing protein [Puniceicoccales bacterium]|jgi:hypothetical protein|nr:ankyrin repeat domain-containing protein [Puniceicoccales bacterium]
MKNKCCQLSNVQKLLIVGLMGVSGGMLQAYIPCLSRPEEVKKFASHIAIGDKCVPIAEMEAFIRSYVKGKSFKPNQMVLAGHQWPIVILAATLLDSTSLQKLLDDKRTEITNLPELKESKLTLLHVAAMNSAPCLKYLIERDPLEINMRSKDGKTPLYLAMEYNNQESINVLLTEQRINVAAVDIMGRTILHVAVMNGDSNVVQQLVGLNGTYGESGSRLEIDAKDDLGKTAADYLTTIKNTPKRQAIQKILYEKNAKYGNNTSVPNPDI